MKIVYRIENISSIKRNYYIDLLKTYLSIYLPNFVV